MSECFFSPAHERDVPTIVRILSEATDYKNLRGDTAWGTAAWLDSEVCQDMGEGTFYLARQAGKVAATFAVQWDDEPAWGPQPPDAGYLHRVAVGDGYHGQQFGRQIIGCAKLLVAAQGRQLLRLNCGATNDRLCAHYEELGFTRVGTRPMPAYGSYVAALFEQPVVPLEMTGLDSSAA